MKPVYVNSGGTLDLICELDDPFDLQWHRALFESTGDRKWLSKKIEYKKIDTSSANGFFMMAHKNGGRGWTQLRKYNVSVSDAGSYKCSRTQHPETSYAVDVNVLQGQCHADRHTQTEHQTDRQTDRQTELSCRQTHRQTDRAVMQTDTHRQTDTQRLLCT